MPKPICMVVISDLHSGGDSAVALPGFNLKPKHKYSLSESQSWLYKCLLDCEQRIKKLARGHHVIFGFGGDGADGVNHHDSTETSGNYSTQIEMAIRLLRPFVNMADEGMGTLGTPVHVGGGAFADDLICKGLGIEGAYRWNKVIGGRRLWWAHHGLKVGKKDHTEENDFIAAARNADIKCLRRGKPKPDLILAGDVHRSPEHVRVKGITVATVGCWQLSSEFGYKILPHDPPDIGALVWWPESMRIERIMYAVPEKYQ